MSQITPFAGLDVLLVEPSSTQAKLTVRMLQNLGIDAVRLAGTGAEALAAMAAKCPDLVLSSLYLPDMAGTDLVQAMRAEAALETVPFLLVSSETRPQVLDPVRQSGACSIVTKPFTEEQLARGLQAATEYLNPSVDFDSLDLENLRVLMVDDSTASRRHMRRILEELGIERITEAVNGREAVACLQETLIDLVVTDYNMPEMDGKELTEYIRTQSWQNAVPIMMVTSEENEGRLAAVQKAGVSAICDKPFDITTVRRLIAQTVAG
ncbi:MAG: Response regulator receiver [Rhodocyclaceae bacterium]|nr:Response regulator receiver [Rhodocyclaceae bacterium]